MRILATLILAAVLAFASPTGAATIDSLNQNAIQKLETEKTYTIDDNFLLAMYAPKIGNVPFTGMYSNKLLSSTISLPMKSFTANASAYTAAADECGKSDGITASGTKVQANRTLACPKQYAFGTKIEFEGMGTYVCEDRGGAITGNHFDIYMQTKSEAFAFGRRNLVAMVVE
jgi:3D (Asp-Asp-Asp) domain-containing protein